MSDDVIWALDQRERCIACPSKPVANAVVLHLGADGALARDAVELWARDGVMAASVAWPGAAAGLDDDDWLDLEDAVTGLAGLASIVAVVGDGDAAEVARTLAGRVGDVAHAGEADRTIVPARLREIAAV